MQYFVYDDIVFWISEGVNDCSMNILAPTVWIVGENLDYYLRLNFKYTLKY